MGGGVALPSASSALMLVILGSFAELVNKQKRNFLNVNGSPANLWLHRRCKKMANACSDLHALGSWIGASRLRWVVNVVAHMRCGMWSRRGHCRPGAACSPGGSVVTCRRLWTAGSHLAVAPLLSQPGSHVRVRVVASMWWLLVARIYG